MREIKFRAWDGNQMIFFNDFKINNTGAFWGGTREVWQMSSYYSKGECDGPGYFHDDFAEDCVNLNIMQYTGLKDKNGREIYEGDKILIKVPYRSTQTHEGDNIPNGSYTEPMEPEIDEFEATVEFKEGAFIINDFESKVWNDNSEILLKWVYGAEYSEEAIKEAIRIKSRNTDSFDFWDDPKDNSGDLQYLLGVYEPNNLFQLIEYLRGVEVIGNIHEHSELIKD